MIALRKIALGAAVTGALAIGGLVAAAPANAAPAASTATEGSTAAGSPAPAMYEEVGPFSSYDGCEISRILDDRRTSPCTWEWDRHHPFGWYYGYLY
jgi:hypothetical protein